MKLKTICMAEFFRRIAPRIHLGERSSDFLLEVPVGKLVATFRGSHRKMKRPGVDFSGGFARQMWYF